jgi:hypothetical protein
MDTFGYTVNNPGFIFPYFTVSPNQSQQVPYLFVNVIVKINSKCKKAKHKKKSRVGKHGKKAHAYIRNGS